MIMQLRRQFGRTVAKDSVHHGVGHAMNVLPWEFPIWALDLDIEPHARTPLIRNSLTVKI